MRTRTRTRRWRRWRRETASSAQLGRRMPPSQGDVGQAASTDIYTASHPAPSHSRKGTILSCLDAHFFLFFSQVGLFNSFERVGFLYISNHLGISILPLNQFDIPVDLNNDQFISQTVGILGGHITTNIGRSYYTCRRVYRK